MAGRVRRISVRLTDAEASALSAAAGRLGLTDSQFVRACLASARPVIASSGDEESVRECSRTIGRMGGLLNQVAHRLNERRDLIPSEDELERLLSLVAGVGRDLAAARSELAELRERQAARIEEVVRR